MSIPIFPEFEPLRLEHAGELSAFCASLPYNACEFPFAAMYLHRNKYAYSISSFYGKPFSEKDFSGKAYILHGTEPKGAASGKDGSPFFSILADIPAFITETGAEKVCAIIQEVGMWKTFPGELIPALGSSFESMNMNMAEDRNNFDYLYLRGDLAALSGKKFHKKKNLVNAFNAAYPETQVRALDAATKDDAFFVLDSWRKNRPDDADYKECAEALELLNSLGLSGVVAYVGGSPAAFSLGEPIAQNTSYCVHFEKGIETYKGIFQFINQAQAKALDESITYINREQDTGDEGLRQAKLTYRPCGFFEKYLITVGGGN